MPQEKAKPLNKKAMTGWYDPAQLAKTGIRVAISTTFGQFADKREALAAANPIDDQHLDPRFDYQARADGDDFWFDFVADTGDGWNPTYAIARLLAQDEVTPKDTGLSLPRARVLIMGGDQVYPTPSPEEYQDRLLNPYEEAYREIGHWPEPKAMRVEGNGKVLSSPGPDLYAIPGNHDWYDGLSSFFHLFCRRTVKDRHEAEVDRDGRVIGGRRTYQTRSYFALRLPHDWWLWGTDSQLEGYIDQPQIDFFQFVAEKWMAPGSKLILCAGTPDWEYVGPKAPEKKYSTLSYLSRLAPAAKDAHGNDKNHELKLVLSGDSHHYARFQEAGLDYITCGGGGAFLHPTHHLKKQKSFEFPYPKAGDPYVPNSPPYQRSFTIATKAGTTDEEALFPSRGLSHALTAGNLLFAYRNRKFTAVLMPIYLLFTWMLDFNARVFSTFEFSPLAEVIRPGGRYSETLWDGMQNYWRLAFLSPWPILLCGVALLGYRYFADVENGFLRTLLGSAHALLQAIAVTAITCIVAAAMDPWLNGIWALAAYLLVSSAVSAIVSATVFGLYLWLCLAIFKIHWNEAFSSLAVEGYKCFLRMHIDKKGVLTVYPVGLRKVPSDLGETSANPPLDPHLIEPAIRIAP